MAVDAIVQRLAKQQVSVVVEHCKVVTVDAVDLRVATGQSERCRAMIKALELKALDVMAVCAVGLKHHCRYAPPGFVVHVVVTGSAECRHRFVPHGQTGPAGKGPALQAMALIAKRIRMLAEKSEARIEVVLEHHVVSAKVIRDVARFALGR